MGYYRQNENNGVFEFAGGIGAGEADFTYYKFYLQSTFGKKWKNIEIGFTPRAVTVYYPLSLSIYGSPDIFLESVLNIRIGGGRTKFQMQFGYSAPIVLTPGVKNVSLIMGFGINHRM